MIGANLWLDGVTRRQAHQHPNGGQRVSVGEYSRPPIGL